jgi:hypothetical protein
VWSIAVEVQLYVRLALAALVLRRRAFRTFLVVLTVSEPLVRLAAEMWRVHGVGLEFAYLDAFALGGLPAFPKVSRRLLSKPTLAVGLLAVVAAISTVQVVAASPTGAPFPRWRAWDIAFPIDHSRLWGYSVLGLASLVIMVTLVRAPDGCPGGCSRDHRSPRGSPGGHPSCSPTRSGTSSAPTSGGRGRPSCSWRTATPSSLLPPVTR